MKKIKLAILLTLGVFIAKSQELKLPDVILHDLEGKEVKSSEIGKDGKPFAICFWAVWNKTSLLELNNIMQKYKEWHDKYKVSLYAISIDEPERISRAKVYVDAHEWKYNVLFDQHGNMEHAMKINGVPHLILFNSEGDIVWQEHEYHSGLEEDFVNEIKKMTTK